VALKDFPRLFKNYCKQRKLFYVGKTKYGDGRLQKNENETKYSAS
jgi:hypothetical protein